MKEYNKTRRTQGGKVDEGDEIVQLPNNHIFWSRVPKGKRLDYDAAGIPLLVDIKPYKKTAADKDREYKNKKHISAFIKNLSDEDSLVIVNHLKSILTQGEKS